MLPLYGGPSSRHSQKILRLKWIPCVCTVVAALVLATVCFDLLGKAQRKIAALEHGQQNDLSGWDGWDGLDRLFVL